MENRLVPMMIIAVGFVVAATALPAQARGRVSRAPVRAAKRAHAPVPKIERGSVEKVICIDKGTLAVRNDKMKVIFAAERFEPVKVFQGWGENKKKLSASGDKETYIKVQFPERDEEEDESIGWVAEDYVLSKSECLGAKEAEEIEEKNAHEDEPEADNRGVVSGVISGINDKDCCAFPLANRPTTSYLTGMRRFGARRSGGKRTHAACDLYRAKNEPILAVAPGKVVRNLYYFYQGTYALEVKHQGGFIVRYGEVTGKAGKGVSGGRSVKTGQTVGYMAKVNSNCCAPMLHFELYKGTGKGALSQKGNKFRRRSDLINPTKHLLLWEQKDF